jgi:hypothetical protein
MTPIQPFSWRRLTPSSAIEYRLTEDGALALRGDDSPPLGVATIRDGRGGFAPRPITALPFAWSQDDDGESWRVRTRGEPTTMAHVEARYGDSARRASESLGVDERLILVTIACEVGDAAPDADGFVKAPRTEPGYPSRAGDSDPGDLDRDALDWAAYAVDPRHRIAHSSHGVMQTLLSTAALVRPDLFEGHDPRDFRTVLWDPETSIACGAAYLAGFPPAVATDPLAARFQYAGGHITPTTANVWGAAPLYDDLVPLMFLAFWNDDACLRAGACDVPAGAALPMSAPAWLFAGCSLLALAFVAALGAAEEHARGRRPTEAR